MKKYSLIIIIISVLLLIIGISLLFSLPLVIMQLISSRLVISPQSHYYFLWEKMPYTIYARFYMFNVTNAKDVEESGVTPVLNQIGPFTYKINITKDSIVFNSNGSLVSFKENMTYHFVRQLSSHNDNVTITTINGPLAFALSFVNGLSPVKKDLAILMIELIGKSLFINRTVRELLFEGYTDLLTAISTVFNPKLPKQSKFGWYFGKNATDDGVFEVFTGKDDIKGINVINKWNGASQLNFWSGECNSFRGSTNSELFAPLNENQNSVRIFRSIFCRSWTMITNKVPIVSVNNLKVLRFMPDEHTFSNSQDYPPNECFAHPNHTVTDLQGFASESHTIDTLKEIILNFPSSIDKSSILSLLNESSLLNVESHNSRVEFPQLESPQLESGVFSLASCLFNTPVYLSYPHFYNADPYYMTTVKGLSPNASLHQSFIDLEPMTGLTVTFKPRVQLNVYVNPPPEARAYRHIPHIVFPVFWEEFTITAPDEFTKELEYYLTVPSLVATIVSALFVASGVILLLCTITGPLWKRYKDRHVDDDSDRLISDDNGAAIGATDVT